MVGELTPPADDPLGTQARTGLLVPFTTHFNVTGQPAISLPLHMSPIGLPVGVQLVAAYGREDLLIRVASQLEQAAPWADRRPVL
jgi:amidase